MHCLGWQYNDPRKLSRIVNLLLIYTCRIHGTGIFSYSWLILMVNVGECTIHRSNGMIYIDQNSGSQLVVAK